MYEDTILVWTDKEKIRAQKFSYVHVVYIYVDFYNQSNDLVYEGIKYFHGISFTGETFSNHNYIY